VQIRARFEQTPDDDSKAVKAALAALDESISGGVKVTRAAAEGAPTVVNLRFDVVEGDDANKIGAALYGLSKHIRASVELAGPDGWDYFILAPVSGKDEDEAKHLGTLKEARQQLKACLEALAAGA
jgi:DNA-directed RNA polymerase specialized sigma24 family protein